MYHSSQQKKANQVSLVQPNTAQSPHFHVLKLFRKSLLFIPWFQRQLHVSKDRKHIAGEPVSASILAFCAKFAPNCCNYCVKIMSKVTRSVQTPGNSHIIWLHLCRLTNASAHLTITENKESVYVLNHTWFSSSWFNINSVSVICCMTNNCFLSPQNISLFCPLVFVVVACLKTKMLPAWTGLWNLWPLIEQNGTFVHFPLPRAFVCSTPGLPALVWRPLNNVAGKTRQNYTGLSFL